MFSWSRSTSHQILGAEPVAPLMLMTHRVIVTDQSTKVSCHEENIAQCPMGLGSSCPGVVQGKKKICSEKSVSEIGLQ